MTYVLNMWFRSLLLATILTDTLAGNVLVLIPSPAKSHAIVFDRLSLELAKRGHDVTVLTSFKLPEKNVNLTEIMFKPEMEKALGAISSTNLFTMKGMNPLLMLAVMPSMGYSLAETFLKDENVQKVLNSNKKYDVIIGEVFLNEAVLAGFSHKLNAPLIAFCAGPASFWIDYFVGNPSHPSFLPEMLVQNDLEMNVIGRAKNLFFTIYADMVHTLYHLPKQDRLMRQYIGDDLPPIHDIVKNTSVGFINSHYALSYPRPYTTNMIEVGGIHVEDPKPLPKDLQQFLDNSKNGAILFSMGSNLQSSMMPPEKIKMFLNAFSRLKQNVLWKFETDSLTDLPKNVKLSKWLPQRDILAHPNLKLFITHGGFLSTTEAIFRAVPVVGLPIFGDQPNNMKMAEYVGCGRSLDFHQITADSLVATVNEVLSNPSYREAVKKRSEILREVPVSAIDKAIYWTEYVMKHKGAPHLRSLAQDLTWYQYYLLDVLLLLTTSLFVTKWTIKFAFKKLFNKNKSKVTAQKKKN